MTDRAERAHRPLRTPVTSRNRKRWAIAGGIAAVWILLLAATHSLTGGTMVLLLMAAFGVVVYLGLRWLGFDRSHPWMQRAATRPWRDGRDVLQLALRHLAEVFVVTPTGSLLAPNVVELRMNPADVASLTEVMDLEVINSSASELYESKVAAHAARLGGPGPVEVSVIADPDVPVGRYRFKQGKRAKVASAAGQAADPRAGWPADAPQAGWPAGAPDFSWQAQAAQPVAPTLVKDVVTVAAPSALPSFTPVLRLVTEGGAAETAVSGARAGRGSDVELPLPDDPTVSRLHAEFTFAEGQWRITGLGRNGVLVNHMPITGEHPLRNGDLISWGSHPGAQVSRVEIG